MTRSKLWELKHSQKGKKSSSFISFFDNLTPLKWKSFELKQIIFVFYRSAGVKGQAVLAPTHNNDATLANVLHLRLPHTCIYLAHISYPTPTFHCPCHMTQALIWIKKPDSLSHAFDNLLALFCSWVRQSNGTGFRGTGQPIHCNGLNVGYQTRA